MKSTSHDTASLAPFIQNLEFLIVDDSSARQNIRSLLIQFGVKLGQIDIVGTLGEARIALGGRYRDVVFIEHSLLGPLGTEQLGSSANESLYIVKPKILFLMTNQDSAAVAANAGDSDDPISKENGCYSKPSCRWSVCRDSVNYCRGTPGKSFIFALLQL